MRSFPTAAGMHRRSRRGQRERNERSRERKQQQKSGRQAMHGFLVAQNPWWEKHRTERRNGARPRKTRQLAHFWIPDGMGLAVNVVIRSVAVLQAERRISRYDAVCYKEIPRPARKNAGTSG
jgi:hypothetical protein